MKKLAGFVAGMFVAASALGGVYFSAAEVAHRSYYWAGLFWSTYLAGIPSVTLGAIPWDGLTSGGEPERKSEGRPGMMIADDRCPKDDNQIMALQRGDHIQIYESIAPVSPEDKNLPADSPLSKKLNMSYVKVTSGANEGEYCWASTVNIEGW